MCDAWKIISDGVVLVLQNAHFRYQPMWVYEVQCQRIIISTDIFKLNIFWALYSMCDAWKIISDGLYWFCRMPASDTSQCGYMRYSVKELFFQQIYSN